MRAVLPVLLVALVCGCMCCQIDLGKESETGEGDYCSPPYIPYGTGCCIDRNGNRICDKDEAVAKPLQTPTTTVALPTQTTNAPTTTVRASTTLAPSPTQAPTTTSPTTTLSQPSCEDGIQNQGEDYVDCGGPCSTNCEVFQLKGSWKEFKEYGFRFDEKEGSMENIKYWIEIKTPDGIRDRRPLTTGESFVDYLRFKVINYGEDYPEIYVRLNVEDLTYAYNKNQDATLLTVGGQSCVQLGSEMCERNYQGYRIRMINRIDNGARLTLYSLDDVPLKVQVKGDSIAVSEDFRLKIGGFFDRSHIMTGGYSLFYVYVE